MVKHVEHQHNMVKNMYCSNQGLDSNVKWSLNFTPKYVVAFFSFFFFNSFFYL